MSNNLEIAIRSGSLQLVKYLLDQRLVVLPRDISYAARYGQLEILKYLLTFTSADEWAITYAAREGHLEIIKYLLLANAPITTTAIEYAISNKHLHIVKYLATFATSTNIFSEDTVTMAASSNYLEGIKWLISQGAPINEWPICYACQYGNLEMLQYLLQANAPLNSHSLTLALTRAHLDLVELLLDNHAPCTIQAATHALNKKLYHILKRIQPHVDLSAFLTLIDTQALHHTVIVDDHFWRHFFLQHYQLLHSLTNIKSLLDSKLTILSTSNNALNNTILHHHLIPSIILFL
jgi:ankyrin repeat protein